MALAEKFGLPDDMRFADSSSAEEQTIEQEFQGYVTSPLSNTDILKFWDVSVFILNYIIVVTQHLAIGKRKTVPDFFRYGLGLPPNPGIGSAF